MPLLRLLIALAAYISMAAHAQTVITIGSGFDNPYGIDLDSAGNVIVADSSSFGGSGAIKRILAADGYTTVQTLVSTFSPAITVDVDSADNIYFTEFSVAAVKKALAAGGYTTVQTLFSTGTVVAALEVDSAANVFTANTTDGAVRRYQAAGGYTTAPLLGSGFTTPAGIALDAASNVYVADFGNNQVKRILAAGNYTTVQTLGSGLQSPAGVAVGPNGDVYVAEYTGAVKRILAAGGFTTVTTLTTGLLRPVDLAVDAAGDVYVSDADGDRVVKILMSVVPTTTAVSSNINPSVFRQTVEFTATVTGNNPTGTVNVFAGPGLLCGAPLPVGSNQVSCSFTALLAQSHSITAVYSGDASNSPSTSPPITQVVNQAATVASVSVPGPITLGQAVVVTASVAVTAPGGGTPTGVIGISDGVVSCNIVLPASSCNLTPTSTGLRTITASYGGDPNYIASSNSTSLQVNPSASSTALTTNGSPSVYGMSVTFTATITGNNPVGWVSFFDGKTPLCANTALISGQAICAWADLTAGSHSITAVYSGDGANGTSSSPPITQVVNQAPTTTSVTTPAFVMLGQSVLVTGTVASTIVGGDGTPTGTISIGDGTVNCSIVLPADSCSLTPTTVGARTITANYSGDANFLASSNSTSLSVDPAGSGTTVASDINPSVFGQIISFTATVSGNTPTGTVDFLDGATPLCSAVVLVSAQAACTTSALTVGPHAITAIYSGDPNNVASTSTALLQTVGQASTVTSVSAPGPITLGQPVLVSATVAIAAPGAGVPTGIISIDDGSANCSITVPATTCSLTPANTGAIIVTASYSGDANFAASSNTANLSVSPAGQTITVVAPGAINLSQGSISITANATSGLPVTLSSNTPGICSVSGSGPFTVTPLAAGLCTLTANQAGDANNAPVSISINLQVQLGQIIALPALDVRALFAMTLLLGLVGALSTRRR